MMIYVANPLYDAVFKYLMEDERIAKIILTALLQKEVIDVKIRRNEYANTNRNTISMYRIDFAATILDKNKEKKLILIELQKTWLETETLRFRQYLALQYNNKENMTQESDGKYAIPTIAVYLLGHRVGEINEPVVYARHHIYDYDGREVKLKIPDPFIESLQHDSIIVQIPLLRGKVNNKLEKVLSVFDQTNAYQDDKRVLKVDESQYAGDDDMEYIVHRLQSAAADPDMRYQMNAEDEFFKAIEDRDTAIMEQANLLKKREASIQAQKEEIKQKEANIQKQNEEIKQKEANIQKQNEEIKQKDANIQKQNEEIKQKEANIQKQNEEIKQKDANIQKQNEEIKQKDANIQKQNEEIKQKDANIQKQNEEIKQKEANIQKQNEEIKQKEANIQKQKEEIKQKEANIQKQNEEIKKKNEMLKNMIKNLESKGIQVDEIAAMLGISEEEIKLLH